VKAMKLMRLGCCCIAVGISMGLHANAGLAHESMAPDMWMAPEKVAHTLNPLPADNKSVARGGKLFLQNCSACHGENAEGLDAEIVGLEKSPPNLKERIKMHPDGDFFWKIQEGRGDMPSFNEDLTEEQIWEVINFIRSEAE
jgi:mono/diheme cytochrome c family protein